MLNVTLNITMPSKPEHGNKSTAGGKGSSAALGKDSGGSDRGGGTGGRNSEGAAKVRGSADPMMHELRYDSFQAKMSSLETSAFKD